jgi:hypothetical protein
MGQPIALVTRGAHGTGADRPSGFLGLASASNRAAQDFAIGGWKAEFLSSNSTAWWELPTPASGRRDVDRKRPRVREV